MLVAVLLGLILTGYFVGWGPFSGLLEARTAKLAGNGQEYSLENAGRVENSPLDGKNILFLGSSVTYGAHSQGVSFVDYIAERNGANCVKEAVSGTTLADGNNSYISRLQSVDTGLNFDLFVCQLSTNDATKGVPLGGLSDDGNYNTSTVCGAIEYIIDYVEKTWGCPVVFYTNKYFESANYSAMVGALKEIQQKHGIGIIDLYSDEAFNDITDGERSLYMGDNIHPTKAGYLKWWTPVIEEYLYETIQSK